MNKNGRKKRTKLQLQTPTTYDVGYAKPPKSTRFKAGKSGNPKGRPKGSRNKKPRPTDERFKDFILAEAYRKIKVNDGEKKITVPMAQAVVRAVAVNAAKGQHRSQQLFAELVLTTERANKALHDAYLETMIEYKVGWEQELERRKALSIVAPDPLPHPDDIVIDMKTGEARVYGPMTKEEKVVWAKFRERIDECNDGIVELKQLAADPEAASYRHIIEDEIKFETTLRDRIQSVIGDWPHQRGKPRRDR